jgi:hypothetical protein
MKNTIKLIGFLAFVAVTGFSMAACDLGNGNKNVVPEVFKIQNNTGEAIYSVFIRAPRDDDFGWGNDLASIAGGGFREINISLDRMDDQYRADIQLKTSAGIIYTKLAQKITHNGTVTFTGNDLDPASPRTITINNNTGEAIYSVYIYTPGNFNKGNDLASISLNDSRIITVSRTSMDSDHKADIHLKTLAGITYTKSSVRIDHNGTVLFTPDDMDGTSPRTITIGNNTGEAIYSVYIYTPGNFNKGNDLASISLNSARTLTVSRTSMDSDHKADIQLKTSAGVIYTKTSVEISHNGNITFTECDLDPESPRTIIIGNNTRESIYSVFIRAPSDDDFGWGNDLGSINVNGLRTITVPRAHMDSGHNADIRLTTTYDGTTTYTKLSVPIVHTVIPNVASIVFTTDDLDI